MQSKMASGRSGSVFSVLDLAFLSPPPFCDNCEERWRRRRPIERPCVHKGYDCQLPMDNPSRDDTRPSTGCCPHVKFAWMHVRSVNFEKMWRSAGYNFRQILSPKTPARLYWTNLIWNVQIILRLHVIISVNITSLWWSLISPSYGMCLSLFVCMCVYWSVHWYVRLSILHKLHIPPLLHWHTTTLFSDDRDNVGPDWNRATNRVSAAGLCGFDSPVRRDHLFLPSFSHLPRQRIVVHWITVKTWNPAVSSSLSQLT